MRKKLLLVLVVAMFAVITAFAFVACDDNSGSGSPSGDRIFTEDATYDEILTAFKNAESATFEVYSNGILLEQYMVTKNSTRMYADFDAYYYIYPANGYYYFSSDSYELFETPTKFYDIYIDTCDFTVSIRNWFDIYFVYDFKADENGKIAVNEEYGRYNSTVKMLGDRLEAIWTEVYDDGTGNVEYSEYKYVYRGINATSFDIPPEVKARESEAEWDTLVRYNGIEYRLYEDEDGSEYYVAEGTYGDAFGPHGPIEETINGLPVRQN